MILEIIEYIPFLVIGMLSAFYAYKLDNKYNYVFLVNRKLNLKDNKVTLIYLLLMCLAMFLSPFIIVIKLGLNKNIAYLISSVTCGFCCYSAMDYKKIVE